jgi:hypothetical protein
MRLAHPKQFPTAHGAPPRRGPSWCAGPGGRFPAYPLVSCWGLASPPGARAARSIGVPPPRGIALSSERLRNHSSTPQEAAFE